MDKEILRELGLAGNEIKTYLALLASPKGMLVSEAAQQAKINRSLTYSVLNSLYRKGLVTFALRENRKYFYASKPEKIIDLLEEKKSIVDDQIKAVYGIIPELKKIAKMSEDKPKITIYEGLEGLKAALEEGLRLKSDYYVIGWSGILQKYAKYWYAHFQRRRIKAKVKRKFLYPHEMRGTKWAKYPLTQARFLPKGYEIINSTVIFSNKTFITIPSEEDSVGIMIESRKIADSYRSQFKVLWELSKS